MNTYKIIKPWTYKAKAFVYNVLRAQICVTKRSRSTKNVRPLCVLMLLVLALSNVEGQNKTEERIEAKGISNIVINGDDIFIINIKTSVSDTIVIKSINDGEYQNYFTINSIIKFGELTVKLNQLPFTDISDDKRNAHKVIAANLYLKIPEYLNLKIDSDIGSVNATGSFKDLYIQLKNGNCFVNGTAKRSVINTFGGNISVITKNASVDAASNNGNVTIGDFDLANSLWILKTIDGNIKVAKQE